MEKYKGIFTALLTPFDKNNRINENELEKLKDLLPMVERTKDPSTDEIEEALAEKYKPCKTYTDLLTNIFASNFVEYGVLKFSARKGH